jgi:hypothetical protein
MTRIGKHAKPKEPKKGSKDPDEGFMNWLSALKRDDPEPGPLAIEAAKPEPRILAGQVMVRCVICETYQRRHLLPPRGHVCKPMGLADATHIRLIRD